MVGGACSSGLRGVCTVDFIEKSNSPNNAIAASLLRTKSVSTFPKAGNGPVDDPSIQARLRGLKWLATHGKSLPAGVERVLVMDAQDLKDLPLTNDDPNLPPGVDVEEFWCAEGRKPSRVLLRHGDNAMAVAVAQAAAKVSVDPYPIILLEGR